MSKWYEIKPEDLSMGLDNDEVHIYLYSDYDGAVYASVPVKDLYNLIERRKPLKEKPIKKREPFN